MTFPKKYPKTVYLKNETWKVVFSKKMKDYGEADPERRIITIKSGMSPRETLATFIHEILHAMHFEDDYDLKHKHVYWLEQNLMAFLMDNFL